MIDINGWEFLLLGVLAILVLGPERLPEYAAKLGRFVRQARGMADRAKQQLKEEMGPEFSDVDWRAYDPRQYDPRRIVRDALSATPEEDPPPVKPVSTPKTHDPSLPTPWDSEAT
ncbi:twin-arginine translocase TatA/TatE family subunit [Intrasporangium calvum]|uniref:Twin-arginine translocation protein, TatB subunit n=1 Tax=Intrasporangium calvum (strain ATCC 23552 / DSM 43043 / JCM 3097 / NBRC 12989 / NCIMB 10167 / NRRL B-3866 / 7 KIP) TaxID=710696 RepID=E6S801_INTC7|nr:twin-arginine translocase TatA/TatE family subunit [Intrasporangium calvum]ADU49097.1 twin-arginine translocation protein, TatB subunit [Intrasporangium calvum DSM 43043]AXG14047.1 preprotein translocase subunit TatA [Intrasporangium calvum]